MKKERKRRNHQDELRAEYDFTNARPNPYAKWYVKGTNVVLLDKDNAKLFRDSESVNRALRALRNAASVLPRKGQSRARRKGAA